MGAKIPKSIKTKVKSNWLQGTSRPKIARYNSIGEGTTTDIHKQSETIGITDFELMMKIALMLKKEGRCIILHQQSG